MAVSLTFVRGTRYDRSYVPLDQAESRVPGSIIEGAIIGIIIYYWFGRKKPKVVCPNCGNLKPADDSPECACGGHFESVDEMKWVDDEK